jgi:hypothetical protein
MLDTSNGELSVTFDKPLADGHVPAQAFRYTSVSQGICDSEAFDLFLTSSTDCIVDQVAFPGNAPSRCTYNAAIGGITGTDGTPVATFHDFPVTEF